MQFLKFNYELFRMLISVFCLSWVITSMRPIQVLTGKLKKSKNIMALIISHLFICPWCFATWFGLYFSQNPFSAAACGLTTYILSIFIGRIKI